MVGDVVSTRQVAENIIPPIFAGIDMSRYPPAFGGSTDDPEPATTTVKRSLAGIVTTKPREGTIPPVVTVSHVNQSIPPQMPDAHQYQERPVKRQRRSWSSKTGTSRVPKKDPNGVLPDYAYRSTVNGQEAEASLKPPTDGVMPKGKCLTCYVNQRACKGLNGRLVGDECLTCRGATAGIGKKNNSRTCVWYDPERGVHCYNDAKTIVKEEASSTSSIVSVPTSEREETPETVRTEYDISDYIDPALFYNFEEPRQEPSTVVSSFAGVETNHNHQDVAAQTVPPQPALPTVLEELGTVDSRYRPLLLRLVYKMILEGQAGDDAWNNLEFLVQQFENDPNEPRDHAPIYEAYYRFQDVFWRLFASHGGITKTDLEILRS